MATSDDDLKLERMPPFRHAQMKKTIDLSYPLPPAIEKQPLCQHSWPLPQIEAEKKHGTSCPLLRHSGPESRLTRAGAVSIRLVHRIAGFWPLMGKLYVRLSVNI